MRIFLSYRRRDVGGYAGRLADALVQRLGADNVFQDVTDITVGQDFTAAIRTALDRCDATLALIGPGWLEATDDSGRSRLFQPDDYVRLELVAALSRDRPVAPVLVGGAALPAAASLPEDLQPLLRRQAIVLRDETWHQDVESLLRSLLGEMPAAGRPTRRRIAAAAMAMALVVALLVALAVWRSAGRGTGSDQASGPSVSPTCPDPTAAGWTVVSIGRSASVTEALDTGREVFTVRAARWRPKGPGRWEVVVDVALEDQDAEVTRHASYRYDSIIVGQRQFRQTCFEASQELVARGTIGDGRTGYAVSCPPGGRMDLILGDGSRIRMTDDPEPSPC